VYGGLIDRVHDLLLCGVDPSLVDLSTCLDHVKSNDEDVYQETKSLLRAASLPWTPSHHTFMYGPEFKAYIASVYLVKVIIFGSRSIFMLVSAFLPRFLSPRPLAAFYYSALCSMLIDASLSRQW
jgi:hypothetical protein